ncbi:MAG: hypothetical protein ACHQET_11985 [Chitinophagales bacterium]
MMKLLFHLTFFLTSFHSPGQNQILSFQKNRKIIRNYSTGTYIAFMDNNRQWQYGIIKKIRNDSLYLSLYMLQHNFFSMDTVHFGAAAYALNDIYAMPKSGIAIDDIMGPNNRQIATYAGHVHFYWIKGGWIFRALGIGYAGLNLFNALVVSNQPVDWVGLAIAAGLFTIGEILHLTWKPYLKLRKKYFLSIR